MNFTEQQNKRRYKLHREVRDLGYKLITPQREIWVNMNEVINLLSKK